MFFAKTQTLSTQPKTTENIHFPFSFAAAGFLVVDTVAATFYSISLLLLFCFFSTHENQETTNLYTRHTIHLHFAQLELLQTSTDDRREVATTVPTRLRLPATTVLWQSHITTNTHTHIVILLVSSFLNKKTSTVFTYSTSYWQVYFFNLILLFTF